MCKGIDIRSIGTIHKYCIPCMTPPSTAKLHTPTHHHNNYTRTAVSTVQVHGGVPMRANGAHCRIPALERLTRHT